MYKIAKTIVVEGRYDKAHLASLFDANIIETGGFRVFSDKRLLGLIRRLALAEGIVLLTDSDRAGFAIRNYIAGSLPAEAVTHIYIPDITGKERRKAKASAEGTLGVEGMEAGLLLKAFAQAGLLQQEETGPANASAITRLDFYELGLSGGAGSATLRSRLKARLNLPAHLGTNALLATLNRLLDREKLSKIIQELQ